MGRFDANPLLSSCSNSVLGISLTKYVDKGRVYSYRRAKLLDLCDVINQYPNQKLNTVVVIAGFNDHCSSIDIFIEH